MHKLYTVFRSTLPAIVIGLGLLAQTAAHAVALTAPAGAFADTALPGTTHAARPELGGTVLEDMITPFALGGVTGTVQNRVVRETGTGTLDFYWKVNVDTAETDVGVVALRLTDFGHAHIQDADWRIDGLGSVAATTGRLFNVANQPAGSINFLFDGDVGTGEASRFFFLHTDATDYAKTAKYDLLAGSAQNISPSYATFAPVPEPSAYVLAIGGLVVAGAAAKSRRRQQA